MLRGTLWFTGAALAALLSVSPALASGGSGGPRVEPQVWVVLPPSQPLTALGAAPQSAAPNASQLGAYRVAQAPVGPLTSATLLPATSQAVGFQVSNADEGTWQRAGKWALAGAAVGAIVGLIDENPFEKALIGGAVGFGLSFVMRR